MSTNMIRAGIVVTCAGIVVLESVYYKINKENKKVKEEIIHLDAEYCKNRTDYSERVKDLDSQIEQLRNILEKEVKVD